VLYTQKFRLSVIPMGENKKPLIPWKEYQDKIPTVREILGWGKENLAIVTGAVSNLVVVDCESRDDAEWFYKTRGQSPVIVRTKRGFHFYFRHPGERVQNACKVENRYDVRGDGGYVLAPPSKHSDGAYSWVKPICETSQLPVFNASWRPPPPAIDDEKAICDGEAYISKTFATSGDNGHNNTYKAVCYLKRSGLTAAEALLAMMRWNRTNADPPWTERELLHKVQSVYGRR